MLSRTALNVMIPGVVWCGSGFFTDYKTTPTKLFCFVLCCWLGCGNIKYNTYNAWIVYNEKKIIQRIQCIKYNANNPIHTGRFNKNIPTLYLLTLDLSLIQSLKFFCLSPMIMGGLWEIDTQISKTEI